MSSIPKLISVEAVSIQLDLEAIANTPYEGFGFSKLLDSTNCSTDAVTDYHFGDMRPTIIKLAHLRDVMDSILKEEITMSKGAEILNQVAVDYYKEKTKTSVIPNHNME